jgi:hypothetical protein
MVGIYQAIKSPSIPETPQLKIPNRTPQIGDQIQSAYI